MSAESVLLILQRAGLIDDADIRAITQFADDEGLHIVPAAIHFGLDDRTVAETLATACRAPLVEVAPIHAEVRDLLSEDEAVMHQCVPIQYEGKRHIVVAFLDPSDMGAVDHVTAVTGRGIVARTITLTTWHRLCRELWPLDRAAIIQSAIHDESFDDPPAIVATSFLLHWTAVDQVPLVVRINAESAEIQGVWFVPEMDGRYDLTRQIVGRLRQMAEVSLGAGVGEFGIHGDMLGYEMLATFSDDDAFTEVSASEPYPVE